MNSFRKLMIDLPLETAQYINNENYGRKQKQITNTIIQGIVSQYMLTNQYQKNEQTLYNASYGQGMLYLYTDYNIEISNKSKQYFITYDNIKYKITQKSIYEKLIKHKEYICEVAP